MGVIVGMLTGVSDAVFHGLNGLSGRSSLIDTLTALSLQNSLVKAAPIGACFIYAWYARTGGAALRARRILLVTLVSLVVVLGVTKAMSKDVFLPRPFVLAQRTWYLDGAGLVETPRLAYHEPLTGDGHRRAERLRQGDIDRNDLGSFPSDHAGFYIALSLGIALACRLAGLIALAWTFIVILAARIITGMHSPLDIAAGALIGAGGLLVTQFIFDRWGRWAADPVVRWTARHDALSSALLFLVIFETANTLENIHELGGIALDTARMTFGA